MKVKNYIYAGLDFVFDHNEEPWFIEANFAPKGNMEYEQIYGIAKPLKEIAKFMRSKGNEQCVIASKDDVKNIENSLWMYDRLKLYLKNIKLCYSQDNKKRRKKLIDVNGNPIIPDSIFKNIHHIPLCFEKVAIVINPECIPKIVNNKLLTIQTIKNYTNLRFPKTFLIKDYKQLKNLLTKKSFSNGFVIKPIEGSCGHNVHIFSKDETPKIRKYPELLEQRITPDLIHRKYWDVRVFVVNGKFLGGIMRESIHRVTNISRGGKPYKIPKRFLKKLKKPALDVVKAIDKEAEKLKS